MRSKVLPALLPPPLPRVSVDLSAGEARHPLPFVHEQLGMALCYAGLAVEERQPETPLDAQPGVVVGRALEEFLVGGVVYETG